MFNTSHRVYVTSISTLVVKRLSIQSLDITLPNKKKRHDLLLREFSETTFPEKTTFASRAKKATHELRNANFRNRMTEYMRAQNAGEKQSHVMYYCTATAVQGTTPPL